MKSGNVVIPESFLIVVDDVGWWLAGEKRYHVDVPDAALAQTRRPYYFEDYESLSFFQRVIQKAGVIQMLEDRGCTDGCTVNIYDFEFDYIK